MAKQGIRFDRDQLDFLKDVKKMGGYKLKKTSVKTHFTLHKGGNTYALYFTPSMAGTYVSLKSRL